MYSIYYICFVLTLLMSSESGTIGGLKNIRIMQYDNQYDPEHGYRFFYENSDRTRRGETGQFVDTGFENPVLSVRGFYSYMGEDGREYKVNYVADENGFQPQMDVVDAFDASYPEDSEDTEEGNSVPSIRAAIKKLWLVNENVQDFL